MGKKAQSSKKENISISLPLTMRHMETQSNSVHFLPPEGLAFESKEDKAKVIAQTSTIFAKKKGGLSNNFVTSKRGHVVVSFTDDKSVDVAMNLPANALKVGHVVVGPLTKGLPDKNSAVTNVRK